MPPVLTAVTPSSAPAGVATPVVISGTGFKDPPTEIQFRGVAGTDAAFVSAEEVTCTTPALSAGLADVVVIQSDGSGILPEGFEFTGGEEMATVLGVNETIIVAGGQVAKPKAGGVVRYAQDSYTAAGLVAASIISFGIRLKEGDIPIGFWFYTAALSTTGTIDFGLHDMTGTAIDIDCFADAFDTSTAILRSSGADGLTTITAAILAGTVTSGLGGIGVPCTADCQVTATINTATATGLIIFGLEYAAAP